MYLSLYIRIECTWAISGVTLPTLGVGPSPLYTSIFFKPCVFMTFSFIGRHSY